MERRTVNPQALFNSLQYGFSQAVVTRRGRRVLLSGQVGVDAQERTVGTTLAEQAQAALDNVGRVLAEIGGRLYPPACAGRCPGQSRPRRSPSAPCLRRGGTPEAPGRQDRADHAPHRQIWQEAIQAPLDLPPTWLPRDLHPRNLLVQGGRISGVIDWGDITAGDPATDLASIWMLFEDPQARREALEAYGNLSEATLQRARGWEVFFGVILLDTGLAGHPRHAVIGQRTLRRMAELG